MHPGYNINVLKDGPAVVEGVKLAAPIFPQAYLDTPLEALGLRSTAGAYSEFLAAPRGMPLGWSPRL